MEKINNQNLVGNSLNKFWLYPLLVAFGIRAVFFISWLNSPFKFYSFLGGLDMSTIIKLSNYKGAHSSIYYSLIYCFNNIFGTAYFIEALVLFQLILGVTTALMVTYIGYSLTSNKLVGALSGVIFGVFAPVLMYEGFVLKETLYLTLLVILLAESVYLAKNNFSGTWSLFLFGFVIFLPMMVRQVGLIWGFIFLIWLIHNLIYRKIKSNRNSPYNIFLKLFLLLLGLCLSVFFMCSTSPGWTNESFGHFQNYEYFLKAGAQKELETVNIKKIEEESGKASDKINTGISKIVQASGGPPEANRVYSHIAVYLKKLHYLFRAYEIPNNLNYYFVKQKLQPLGVLLGPLALFPLAFIGLFLMVLNCRKILKLELILLFILPTVASAIAFIPLARYRIALAPVFALAAAYFIVLFLSSIYQKKYLIGTIWLILLICLYCMEYLDSQGYKLRSTDFIAHGQAVKLRDPKDKEILRNFIIAYKIRPDKSNSIKNLSAELLERGRFENAAIVLSNSVKKYPDDFDININYVASLLGSREYKRAHKVLTRIKKPVNKADKLKYFYNWGEYYLITGKYKKALKNYNLILDNHLSDSGNFNIFIRNRINQLKKTLD